MANLQV